MPADLFAPVERVVAKYRRDVHQLAAPASAEAISSLEGHLKRVLPEDMRTFLAKYNGGSLFRGALRLRTTSDITPASETAPQVVLYADAQGDRRWAWAADGNGGHVFGVWNGQELEGLYASYSAWLASEVSLLDTQVSRPEDQDALRLESDPNDV